MCIMWKRMRGGAQQTAVKERIKKSETIKLNERAQIEKNKV